MDAKKLNLKEKERIEIMDRDRISELPDHLILYILSFIPTIVSVQMSILSRHWRYMWARTYSLYLCNFCDIRSKQLFEQNDFYKFLGQYLEHRLNINKDGESVFINSFTLKMGYGGSHSIVDRYLTFAMQSKVKELELCTGYRNDPFYCLPDDVLHGRSLTTLELSLVKLVSKPPFSVDLPSLKILSLTDVSLHDEMLHNLILGCPSLEDLLLIRMYAKHAQISSKTLKFFKADKASFKAVLVETPNLKSFLYSDWYPDCLDINFVDCVNITCLSLRCVELRDTLLEAIIGGLPVLETLTLDTCYDLQYIKIFSEMLREFVLVTTDIYHEDNFKVNLDTPNLVSFSYEGSILSSIFLNAPNLLDVNIKFYHLLNEYRRDWYFDMLTFLEKVDFSGSMRLVIPWEEDLIFPKKYKSVCRPPLSTIKHLKVETIMSSKERDSELIKDALWYAPSVATLSINNRTVIDCEANKQGVWARK